MMTVLKHLIVFALTVLVGVSILSGFERVVLFKNRRQLAGVPQNLVTVQVYVTTDGRLITSTGDELVTKKILESR